MQQQLRHRSGVAHLQRSVGHSQVRRGKAGVGRPQAALQVSRGRWLLAHQLLGLDEVPQVAAKQIQDPLSQLLPPSEDHNKHLKPSLMPGHAQIRACEGFRGQSFCSGVSKTPDADPRTFLSTCPARTFTSVAMEIIAV